MFAIAAVAFVVGINLIVIETAKPLIVSAEDTALLTYESGTDCILVLGASVTQERPSHILAHRLDKGIELFGLGVSDIMLLSGDNETDDYNEVQIMKNYVLEHGEGIGITDANIYVDAAGFSTYYSAVRCKEVFQAERVVIVTQRYHLYRAVYNAKKVGLDVYGVAADDIQHGQWRRDLREVPARIKDFFLSLVGYTPTAMGDPTPLIYPSTQQG